MSFDPMEHQRKPRDEGWAEETKKIAELLEKRGDQRIGQLIINAVRTQYSDLLTEYEKIEDEDLSDLEAVKEYELRDMKRKARIEKILWSLEAPELLEALENFMNKGDE